MPEQRDWREEVNEKARTAARVLSDWVNDMGHKNEVFVQAVMLEHRTLQQQMFGVMLACMAEWAKAEHYDAKRAHRTQEPRNHGPVSRWDQSAADLNTNQRERNDYG